MFKQLYSPGDSAYQSVFAMAVLMHRDAKERMERLQIKENTLKYHNRNIYTKLGVDSRRHRLQYAALMEAPTLYWS